MPTHSIGLTYHPLGFAARCTCGWRGVPHTVEDSAWDDAETHRVAMIVEHSVRVAGAPVHGSLLELAGAGSETLDEYRRRVI